jgi:hypothetical protein
MCPTIWAPVCGSDGRTYGNVCEASCGGIEIAHEGECDTTCACPEIYAPVCGSDGRTYGNACEADCAGVPVVSEGPCECPAIPPIWCEWGYATDDRGCPTPECLPPPACEPVVCDLYCERGYRIDERGCETCSCIDDPICPEVLCDIACEFGHVIDDRGCATCACNEPPTRCYNDDDCGAGASCDLHECLDCDAPDGWDCAAVCIGTCRPLPPPPPTVCFSDSDCAAGQLCAVYDCAAEARPGSDDGTEPTTPPTCTGAGVCIDFEPPPPPPTGCSSDMECAPEEHCELIYCATADAVGGSGSPGGGDDGIWPCPVEGYCVADHPEPCEG